MFYEGFCADSSNASHFNVQLVPVVIFSYQSTERKTTAKYFWARNASFTHYPAPTKELFIWEN